MNTRDQFGNYLLLKKLAEDPLGETFRAGKIGRQNLERVVLLRVLNGAGFDAERIARALQARSSLAQALKSPTIGQATDVGQVRGVPYIAYDYASGRSLSQLLEQAARRSSPLPLDHALLVAERVALALAVAHEMRLGDERVQHGFLTPQLVLVTNEGELKLLGFEASTGLRESAAHPNVKQSVGRYLAPEVIAGQPPAKADDVFGLGALLYEMVTGQAWSGQATALDTATVAAEGTPLPADLGALLKRSLAPRDQRLPDALTWHKTIAKLMADNGWAATTFNLAFFLHNLFRDEIDRESRELESEKSQAASLVAAAAARAPEPGPAAAAPSAVRGSGPVREDTSVLRDEYGLPAKKSGGPNMALIGGAAAVLVLGAVGYFLFGRGGGEVAAPPPQAPAAAPAAEAAPAPTGMTPEQIQDLLNQALEKQRQEIEAGLKAASSQQAEEIKALQQQLDSAQRARATAPPPSVAIAAPPAAAPATAPTTTPATTTAAAQPAPAAATPPASNPAQPTTTATTPAPATATPTQPAPRPAPTAPAAVAPAAPTVREGDLVTMAAGVTPPRVVRQPPLSYPQVARRLRKEANITVRVLVDENGRVVDVDAGNSKAGFGLDEAAVSHARNCQWEPARKDGVKVKMWTDLRVVFKL
ncbi:MAG: TonB family protein [Thermoanaerobaculia bacterium]|nr:TonB family protein [Thermoanaerobaculia bacterium]